MSDHYDVCPKCGSGFKLSSNKRQTCPFCGARFTPEAKGPSAPDADAVRGARLGHFLTNQQLRPPLHSSTPLETPSYLGGVDPVLNPPVASYAAMTFPNSNANAGTKMPGSSTGGAEQLLRPSRLRSVTPPLRSSS